MADALGEGPLRDSADALEEGPLSDEASALEEGALSDLADAPEGGPLSIRASADATNCSSSEADALEDEHGNEDEEGAPSARTIMPRASRGGAGEDPLGSVKPHALYVA